MAAAVAVAAIAVWAAAVAAEAILPLQEGAAIPPHAVAIPRLRAAITVIPLRAAAPAVPLWAAVPVVAAAPIKAAVDKGTYEVSGESFAEKLWKIAGE